MTEVIAGFFSFTEVTRPDQHRAYNEWHQLDHMPEQHPLPGIAWGERWVSTPACRAARTASGPLLDPVHYVTLYLMAAPLDQTLADFFRLARELRDLDRFFEHRNAPLTGPHDIVGTAAAPRVLVSPASIPFRPNLGVHVRVDRDLDVEVQRDRLDALVEVPGVAGAWAFRRRPDDGAGAGDVPQAITVAWLDGEPLDVAASIAALPPDGDPVFEGPFERVELGRWDWFD